MILKSALYSLLAIISALVLLLVAFFDRPITETNSADFLAPLTIATLGNFDNERRLPKLMGVYNSLKTKQDFCFSPMPPSTYNTWLNRLVLPPIAILGETDFRPALWEMRIEDLTNSSCEFTRRSVFEVNTAPADLRPSKIFGLLKKQWDKTSTLLQNKAALFKLVVFNPTGVSRDYLLSFGILNGTSLVLVNGKPYAYFVERLESDRLIHVTLEPKANTTIELLQFGKGFVIPGLTHRQFYGLVDLDTARTDLFPSNIKRNDDLRSGALSAVVMALLIFILGFSVRERDAVRSYLALFLFAFALNQSLELDHIQSSLSASVVQSLRLLYVLSVLVSVGGLVTTFSEIFFDVFQIWQKITKPNVILNRPVMDGYRPIVKWLLLAVLFGPPLIRGIPRIGSKEPLTWANQQTDLLWGAHFATFFGVVLTLTILVTVWLRTRLSESSAAREATKAIRAGVSVGLAMLLFGTTQVHFFDLWVKKYATLSTLLKSQAPMWLILIGFLYNSIKDRQELAKHRKVQPLSTLEMIREATGSEVTDRTATTRDWIILNDLVGSSIIKLTQLSIATQLFLNELNKINKEYFAGLAHFNANLGDATLITLKSPLFSIKNDPLLDKLVRSFALHMDGAKELQKRQETIIAILRLMNEELFLALNDREKEQKKIGIVENDLKFRTILTIDGYYFGLNSEMSTIDSKGIYVVAKSEKHISGTGDGGFIVFPDLMDLLELAFPKINVYFTKAEISKSKLDPKLAGLLPQHAFLLKESLELDFSVFLESLSGAPLFLRESSQTAKAYAEVRPEIRVRCEDVLQKSKSLDELMGHIRQTTKVLANFAEKNLLIQTISSVSVRFDVWNSPHHSELKNLIFKIGVPAKDILHEVEKRDIRYEPSALLKAMASRDPVTRNDAVKLLRFVRTRSTFRPSSRFMTKDDFTRKALQIYLNQPHLYSVESHFDFFELIKQAAKTGMGAEIVNENRTGVTKLLIFLEGHPAPSLNGLAQQIRKTLTIDSNALSRVA